MAVHSTDNSEERHVAPSNSEAAPQNPVLQLPPVLDVTEAGEWRETSHAWLARQTETTAPRIILEDPSNVISVQLAVAIRREAVSRSLDVEIEGPDGQFPEHLLLGSPEENAA